MAERDQDNDDSQFPEVLPPVEPPSAGFVMQLFIVPGIIVGAIFGVWLLFGKIAGDQDWRSQISELEDTNVHRRWRAAVGLSQILNADQNLGPASEHLSQNRELAEALSRLLRNELKNAGQSPEDFTFQAFLARTLGLFDLPEVVVPVLETAMGAGNDREVRKNALGAVAVMAERLSNRENMRQVPGLVAQLVEVSRDDDVLVRQLAAFTLGMFRDSGAHARLEVLLEDGDANTRMNAAVAFGRQGDIRCAKVLHDYLADQSAAPSRGSEGEFEQFLSLKNCFAAIEKIAPSLPAVQRAEFAALLAPMAENFPEPKLRIAAKTALMALREPK